MRLAEDEGLQSAVDGALEQPREGSAATMIARGDAEDSRDHGHAAPPVDAICPSSGEEALAYNRSGIRPASKA